MQNELWSIEDQHYIELYVIASKEDKKIIFNYLYPTLVNLIDIANKQHNYRLNEDDIQDIVIRLYEYSLNNIDVNRVKAAQQYIYISINKLALNVIRGKNTKKQRINRESNIVRLSELNDYDLIKDKNNYKLITY